MIRTVGIIPARYASTRFPGKPLALLRGRPMIQWVIEGSRKSKLLNEIIVATDHPEIAEVSRQVGATVVMTDSDLPTGTDRIYAAVKSLKSKADVVINIQGDEPLINETWIDPLVQAFHENPQLEMATLSHALSPEDLHQQNAVKVIVNQKQEAIYFSRWPIPHSRQSAKAVPVSQKHIGLYGYRADFLKQFCETPETDLEKAEGLEQLRALYLGAKIKVIFVEKPTIGVDTPEDLHKVEALMQKNPAERS